MKILKSLTFILLATALFTACQKDPNPVKPDDTGNRITPPTAEEFSTVRKKALEGQTQKLSVDLDTLTGDQITFTSENGAEVKIAKSPLNINGEPVSGKIDIRFIELYDAGHMLITNKTTMGYDDNGNLVPIITGGAFYLEISQNGQPVNSQPAYYQINVPGTLTGGVDSDMKLWAGTIDEQDNLTWKKIDPARAKVSLGFEDTTYNAVFDRFGWTNIDKFASYDGPKTKMEVKVPAGFNDSNSVVYLKYKGEPNALARLDKYEDSTQLFTEHYGWIPIGEEVHLIFASVRSDGKWLIGIKDNITISANTVYEFTSAETQIVDTDSEVVQMINDLP